MSSKEPKSTNSGAEGTENRAKQCRPAPKWAAVINDQNVPAPQQKVRVSVLKAQAGIDKNHTLFRDSSPRGDSPLNDDDIVDLAEGNTFYSKAGCFQKPAHPCAGKPKLTWFVNDHPEETLLSKQTAQSIRELFNIPDVQCLVRDLESPNDEEITEGDTIQFADGPVFITRCNKSHPKEFTIIVNTRKKTVSKSKMTYDEVICLAFDNPPSGPNICITVTYRRGPACNSQGTLVQGCKPVKIQNGMIFDVTATDKS